MNKYYLCGAINYRDMDKDIFLAKIERRYRLYLYPFALLSFDAMLQKVSKSDFHKKWCLPYSINGFAIILFKNGWGNKNSYYAIEFFKKCLESLVVVGDTSLLSKSDFDT